MPTVKPKLDALLKELEHVADDSTIPLKAGHWRDLIEVVKKLADTRPKVSK